MGLYLFVLASAIAVFGILFFFKRNVELIKEDPYSVADAQKNFFIGTAIVEAIPLILLIIGFVNQAPVPREDIYIPLFFIVALIGFALFFIFLQRAVGVDEESKQAVTSFSMIGIMVVNAIPVIAVVFLFMVAQG